MGSRGGAWTAVFGAALAAILACGAEEGPDPSGSVAVAQAPVEKQALALSLARFPKPEPGKAPVPLPATLEFLVPTAQGMWEVVALEDPESNVFHKAMSFPGPEGEPRLLTVAGSEATVKTWENREGQLAPTTLWKKNFGGRFSRMRDVEIADVYGDGAEALAVATHDQGIVAILRPDAQGAFSVEEIDREPETFVHEIETGDLDGDGVVEVYATPSEPNRLDGRQQKGSVVRYVPAKGEGRVVVADLGMRHAKEILVDDVDGDGRDELYVAVEGEMDSETKELSHGVEIRRFDAGTDPGEGVTVAEIPDRLSRFLTAGDIDGDGKKEMVVATFSQGLWLLRPGPDGQWELQSFDKKSGGFEHASILADLDEDGLDELYVASDNEKLVRQYRWKGNRLVGRVIYRRKDPGSVFTWNVMPVPVELVPRSLSRSRFSRRDRALRPPRPRCIGPCSGPGRCWLGRARASDRKPRRCSPRGARRGRPGSGVRRTPSRS